MYAIFVVSAMNIPTNDHTKQMAKNVWAPKNYESSKQINESTSRRRISFKGVIKEVSEFYICQNYYSCNIYK